MGEDELGQSERVAVPAPVRLVIATKLLLPEMVQMMMALARVIPHRALDPCGVLGGDAPVDLDDVRLAAVLVSYVVAHPDGCSVVERVFEGELRHRVSLRQAD